MHPETVLESATLAAKVILACCELPILDFLKPAAALCILICETAKTVIENKDAAMELSDRSAQVLDVIVDHLRQKSPTTITPDLKRDALRLNKTLEKVHQHVEKLKKRKRGNIRAWLLPKGEQDEVLKLKTQLNDALSIFGISRTLALGRQIDEVHGNLLEACQDVKQVLSREGSAKSEPKSESKSEPGPNPEQRLCWPCGETMRRFTARNGRPYVKCDHCNKIYAERDPRIPACFCGLSAKLRMARTEAHYGQKFRGCPKRMSDDSRCNFFRWASDTKVCPQ